MRWVTMSLLGLALRPLIRSIATAAASHAPYAAKLPANSLPTETLCILGA